MKTWIMFLSSLIAVNFAVAATPQIEVEVRFIDICETVPDSIGISGELGDTGIQSMSSVLTAADMANLLTSLDLSGSVDLLSAPKVTTASGSNATIKVVSEYRYATDVDIRRVSVTNGGNIVHSVAVVPSNFETRDVGITLNVTPVFDPKLNIIDLQLMAEVVSDPIWKDYTVEYKSTDGTKQTVAIAQPFFHTRNISQSLSINNNATVVMGGMITAEKKRVEKRVPILGAIPWLGRLFRSIHEVNEKRNLLISITARTVNESQ